MSKRRNPGEVVWKPPGAGYYKNGGYGKISPSPGSAKCTQCDDPACREWPVLLQLADTSGISLGTSWCYISECEMLDASAAPAERQQVLPKPLAA